LLAMCEHVYMVWDYYDGPVSGIADLNGTPHYFQGIYDEKEQEYSEVFEATPIDDDLLKFALENQAIYREWEIKFQSGLVEKTTHPGNGGQNNRYDELEVLIREKIEALPNPTQILSARFRGIRKHPELPKGILIDFEVQWDCK